MIENLTKEAEHDKLTGFLNKASGTAKIAELCASRNGVLLVMDIDSFKLVNDLYGHEMGDRVLISFADTVRKNTRADDVISRIGGDEFLAFLPDIKEEKIASAIVRRLNEQFMAETKNLMGENHDIPIGISVGGALTPIHSADFETLFQYADQTMYKVKTNGKHGFSMYASVSNETDDSVDLESEIARVSQIVGERGEGGGAMLLGQDSFSWNYRFVMRFIKRYKGEATKIIFAVSSEDGTADMSQVTEEFGMILRSTLRISDIIMQNRSNQFFLLLPELSAEDVKAVVERILKEWNLKKSFENLTVEYSSSTVSYKDA